MFLAQIIVSGATHGTDASFLFGKGLIFSFPFSEEDNKMLEIMTKLFTNFAKYGFVLFLIAILVTNAVVSFEWEYGILGSPTKGFGV